MSIITLLSDFGARDGFVGALKGVILSLNPHVHIIDIAHEIAPGDINAGAFVLASAYSCFPPDTIHVAVIDPGVGTTRKPLAVRANSHYFVAPDNGILKWILSAHPDAFVMELTEPQFFKTPLSNTFHGRDLFAPVAAHLSLGVPIARMGKPCTTFEHGVIPVLRLEGKRISGEIIYIDRFGNLVSNIPAGNLRDKNITGIVLPRHTIARLSSNYRNNDNGPVALIGSHGFLEIALDGQNANEILHYGIGAAIDIYFTE
ncbi:MAG TPA: SAM-dependent chlorinase/fluorinase [bacterium]|nr:SAM-dependent chlorinase/fluorinase [bacterium]HPN45393.1 SAM-dependent chlorinase/fluorinase [bacterium]